MANRRDLMQFSRREILRTGVMAGIGVGGLAAGHTAAAQNTNGGTEQWAFETGDSVRSSPIAVDGTVYIGSDDGNLYAVDAATGDEQWAFDTGDAVYSSPTVADGTVYVGSDVYLYAVDAASGDERWAFETGDSGSSSPAVADGTVYVGSRDNNLYAVDAATGDAQWAFKTGDYVTSSPTVADGTVYVGSWDNNLYAVDAATGDEQWAFDTGESVGSSPTVADGTVYVGSQYLYAVDAATGDEQWAFETDESVGKLPTVADGTVYVGSWDNNLYAVDAATGEQQWAFETDGSVYSSPTVADGTVYVGSWDNNLYAVDAADGTEQWSLQTGSRVSSSPMVVDDTVYVGSDNYLYAVDAATGDNQVAERATPEVATEQPTEPEYKLTVTRVEGSPDKVSFTVTITDTKSLGRLRLVLSDGQNGTIYADSTNGFEEAGSLDGKLYKWDSETENPSLTVLQSIPRGNSGLSTDNTVIVETPQIGIHYNDEDSWENIYSEVIVGPAIGVREITGPDGATIAVSEGSYTAVGDVSLERISRNETEFWVTEVGNATVNATDLATMFGDSQQYLAGQRPSEVSVFAVGDNLQVGFGAGFTNRFTPSMIVSADEPMTGPDNTWLHEYVHVQQSPISAPRESNWWTEAIAEYQTARVAPVVTDTSPAESYFHIIRGAENTAPLRAEDPPTVESSYERGPFVLLCLSIRISQASNGNRSVQDVIEILYEPDYYSADRITRTVGNQSNESVASWFENAVNSRELPEEPSYQAYRDLPSRPPAMNPMPTLTPESTEDGQRATTQSPTDTEPATPTDEADNDDGQPEERTEATGPGFGLGSGIASLGGVAYLLRQRLNGEEESD